VSTPTKDCPRCGMTTDFLANCCRCGHIFTAEYNTDIHPDMASQEEEAYEAYLAARLDQARIAAERAIKILSKDPADQRKIVNADRANQELEQINNEYAAQLVALEAAHSQARDTRLNEQNPSPELSQRTLTVKNRSPKTRSLAAPPKIVSLSSSAVSAERAKERQVRPAPAPNSRAVTHARSGRLRQDASEAILARRAAQQLIAQRAQALAARRPGQTTMPEKMRESTRDQAEKAVQRSRSPSSRISGDLAAAAQALDAKTNIKPMSQTIMECPNCTTRLPVTAKQCGCGYSFATSADTMPGLSLDIKDLF